MNRVLAAIAIMIAVSFDTEAIEPKKVEAIKNILRNVRDTDQTTRNEIEEQSKIYKPDSQEIRLLWKKQNEIDSKNQNIVADILKTNGWPKAADFGSIGPAQVVFLVIQHANLEYQKRYYEMVRTAAEAGDVQKSSFALLQDRILVREGNKQVYGSQVKVDQTGATSFYPIEDEVNVDKRRASVGLEPLIEYAKRMGFEYTPPNG